MSRLHRRAALGALAAAPLAAPAILRAETPMRLRMTTSWPRDLPGPGVSAQRVADRIATATGGRIEIEVFAAGEIAPALDALDVVAAGDADVAHTSSTFWSRKARVAPLFTAGPFGLTPIEHVAWLTEGGGQTLWNALYARLGVKPLPAGNTGMSMGGWFKTPIAETADLQGLRWRMPGLGGDMFSRLGVRPISLAPGETRERLMSGGVDAAEFAGPASDLALGLHEAASYYYWPGLHEPNGGAELLVNADLWGRFPSDVKAAFVQAAAEETLAALAESEVSNRRALASLVGEHGAKLTRFPDGVVAAARDAADDLFAELRALGGLQGRIAASYDDARRMVGDWPRISAAGFIGARA